MLEDVEGKDVVEASVAVRKIENAADLKLDTVEACLGIGNVFVVEVDAGVVEEASDPVVRERTVVIRGAASQFEDPDRFGRL